MSSTNLINFYGDPASIFDLCGWIIDGERLPQICARLNLRYADVIRWISGSEDRQRVYEAALAGCGDRLAFECLDIADGNDNVQTKRVRIQTRLQIAARWYPARYADRPAVAPQISLGGNLYKLVAESANKDSPSVEVT